jgi:hypothetical protein
MAIEIRELVIRAVAGAAPADADPSATPPAAQARPAAGPTPNLADERDALVARCVREVLRELKKSRAR